MEIRVELFDKICRVCLTESTNMRSLFSKINGEERQLHDALAFTANIVVKVEEALPKQICNDCESILCKADAFKWRCLDSNTILNKIFHNQSNAGNVSINTKKCIVKDETKDFRQKLSGFCDDQSSNSANCYFEDEFDKKNILVHEFAACPPVEDTCDKYGDTKVTENTEKSIKVENTNDYDDQIELGDHCNDDIHNETLPVEFKKEELETDGNPYICCCRATFTNEEKYKDHVKQHNCFKFKRIFDKLDNPEVINIIPISNRLECVRCNRTFATPNGWKVHQRQHEIPLTKTIPYQCSLCLRKFKRKNVLLKHIQKHKEPDVVHKCEICKREFKYKATLENHILSRHAKNDSFACEVCSKGFLSKESLEKHKEIHKIKKNYQCSVCNRVFFMSCSLKEHMRTHTGEKPYLCSQCGRGFSQKTNLAQHMMRHQGVKPYKCKTCEKGFVSKGELEAHTRKHSGAHPFVCDECGNGFTTSSALVKHRRIHTGERPYHCDLCPMKFAASGTLANHRRTHTGEKPFQCSYCGKAFGLKNDLICHIRCHTGERPYICTQCGHAFRKSAALKAHLKMHGKEMQNGVSALQGVNNVLGMQ